jgi:predicted secreted protein
MDTRARKKIAAGALALALTALGALVLVACGGSGGGGTPQTIAITPEAQTGATVDAKVGDTVVVTLDANATTGYEWSFIGGDTFTIVSSEYVPDPNPSGLAGKGGSQVVTLEVTKAGTSDLTGVYAQSWNSPSPDAGPDFSMTVTSTD